MHYRVGPSLIRSEYTAKSMRQPSHQTVTWLRTHSNTTHALDYGCGRLRYAVHLAPRSQSLTLVDSHQQLSRVQLLGRQRCSVIDYVDRYWPHARCVPIATFAADSQRYSVALCANVLSAIPEETVRARAMKLIAGKLLPRGRVLFVTQYQNSYFEVARARSNARPHLDGWILDTERGSYFYGLIPRLKLEQLVEANNMMVVDSWSHNGSAYVVGSPT